MRRSISATVVLLGLFAAPAQGQLILAEPGQVVAGKTLLSASQPHLAGDNVNLVFIGEFDEAPEDDVADLRQGVFTLNLEDRTWRDCNHRSRFPKNEWLRGSSVPHRHARGECGDE